MSTFSADERLASLRDELALLFDENYENVYRFCLARSGSHEVAQDISSEVFAEAARRFAGGDNEGISVAWLITVARRRLIDLWRSKERSRRRIEQMLSVEQTGSVSTIPEPDVVVLAALRSLPGRQRLALTLRYLDDLSVQEVADVLQCGYQAAESVLARGRRSFAKAYEALS